MAIGLSKWFKETFLGLEEKIVRARDKGVNMLVMIRLLQTSTRHTPLSMSGKAI